MNSQMERKKAEKIDLIEIQKMHHDVKKFYEEMDAAVAKFSEDLKVMYSRVQTFRLETTMVKLQYEKACKNLDDAVQVINKLELND